MDIVLCIYGACTLAMLVAIFMALLDIREALDPKLDVEPKPVMASPFLFKDKPKDVININREPAEESEGVGTFKGPQSWT
jgi:hypothetical protein